MGKLSTLLGRGVALYAACLFATCIVGQATAQTQCGPEVPTYNVDLSGDPDSLWAEESVELDGNCCPGQDENVNCTEIILTLDEDADGISFSLEGAFGFGNVEIQIDCGPEIYEVGEGICLEDSGPHHITLCRSGSPTYDIKLQSLGEPDATPGLTVAESCIDTLHTSGFDPSTIHWETVNPEDSAYISYLDCPEGCEETQVQPDTQEPPDSVEYRVCGILATECDQDTVCLNSTVYFHSDLGAFFVPEDPVVCYDEDDIEVTAHGEGGAGDYSFQWSTGASGSTVNLPEGTHTVEVYDGSGCPPGEETIEVAKMEEPLIADAGEEISICRNNPVAALNGTIEGTDTAWWEGNGTFDPGTTNLQANYIPTEDEMNAGSATVYLIAGNPFQHCSNDTDAVTITILPPPQPEIDGPTEACPINMEHTYQADNQADHSYDWSVDNGEITGGEGTNEVSVIWDEVESGTLTLTKTDDILGCDTTVFIEVDILEMPAAEISGPTDVCEFTGGYEYSVTPNTKHSYDWEVTNGTIVSGTNTSSVTVEWHESETGIVSLSKLNTSNGCMADTTLEVTIHPLEFPEIDGPEQACASSGDILTYTAPGDPNDYTFQWTTSNGEIVTSDNGPQIGVNWTEEGTGLVILERTNELSGCTEYDTLEVETEVTPETAIEGDEVVCVLDDIYTYEMENIDNTTYNWQVTGGEIVANNGHYIEVQWDDVEQGTVQVEAIRESLCDEIITMQIQISTYADGDLKLMEYEACIPFTPRLDVGNVEIVDVHWDFGDMGRSRSVIPDITITEPGDYEISVFVKNALGCEDTFRYNITALDRPDADFEFNFDPETDKIYDDEAIGLFNLTQRGSFYQWQMGDGTIINRGNLDSIMHEYDEPGYYDVTLIAENEDGCTDTRVRSFRLHSLEWLHVPNAISTKGNVENRTFRIMHRNIDEFEVIIANRWGEILYRSDDPDFKWNGKYQGELVPEGVYIFQIQAWGKSGDPMHSDGTLHLIR